ncbi:MAG: iron chaperone, partial [Gemmatimonadales bacterium]
LPAFKLEGRILVCYRAAKDHLSLHPMSGEVIRTLAPKLKAYSTSRGTIRFGPKKPLPSSLVRSVIRARVAELHKRK